MSLLGQSSAMHGLKLPARSLCALSSPAPHAAHAEPSTAASSHASPTSHSITHSFLVGTCSAQSDNEVCWFEYEEEENEIRCAAVFSHPQEVYHISSCPHENTICATTYSVDANTSQATIWRLPSHSSGVTSPTRGKGGEGAPSLTRLVDLKGHVGKTRQVVWQTREGERQVATLDSQGVRIWQLNGSSTELESQNATLLTPNAAASAASSPANNNSTSGPMAACFDPHHACQLSSADGRHLRFWDLRAAGAGGKSLTSSLQHAHEDLITDVDYNPNKPFHLLSAGADRKIHVWDVRNMSNGPLRTLGNHTHWIAQARFNRFHDQLLLTAGTELVNLWSVTSISSAPIGELEAPSQGGSVDTLIKTYSDHEDSVVAAAWSSYDAWCFATLSFDGRIVINHVPPAEKYKILL